MTDKQEHIILLLKLDDLLTDISFEIDYDSRSADKLAQYGRELINNYLYKWKQIQKDSLEDLWINNK